MNRLRAAFRWTVGALIAAYLLLAAIANVPWAQTWLAGVASDAVGSWLGAEVSMGRVRLGMNGRVIIDNTVVHDRSGEEMLRVSRLGTKINLWKLMGGSVRIGNVQLFGARANLYQNEEGGETNFRFVVDALTSSDTTHTPLDIYIGQVLVRRTNVRWRQRWTEETPGKLNTGSLQLDNISITAELHTLTNDSLSLRLRRFEAEERLSGLSVRELSFRVEAGDGGVNVEDLHLAMPHSTVDAPRLALGTALAANSRQNGVLNRTVSDVYADIRGEVDSRDIASLLPPLARVDDRVSFSLRMGGEADRITVEELTVGDSLLAADISLSGVVRHAFEGIERSQAEVDIKGISFSPAALTHYANTPLLENIGDVSLSGSATLALNQASAEVGIHTAHGDISVRGTAERDGDITVWLSTDSLHLGTLTALPRLGTASLSAEATADGNGTLAANADVQLLEYNGYPYRNMAAQGRASLSERRYEANLRLADPNISLTASGSADLRQDHYTLTAEVENIAPNALGMTDRYPDTSFGGSVTADLRGSARSNIDGMLHIDDLGMHSPDTHYKPGDIHLTATHSDDGRQRLTLISPFLEAEADGQYKPSNLAGDMARLIKAHMPTMAKTETEEEARDSDEYCTFLVRVYDTRPLRHIFGVDIGMDGTMVAEGSMDMDEHLLGLTVKAPHIVYGKEDLRDVSLRVESYGQSLFASAGLKRLMKGTYVDFGVEAGGTNERLTTKLRWNSNGQTPMRGDVNILSRFPTDSLGHRSVECLVLPSEMAAGDSLWQVYPGSLSYNNGTLAIDSLALGNSTCRLALSGRASSKASDTLRVSLRNIDLSSVFSLINFNAVEFDGQATGEGYVHSLFSKPYADTRFSVPQLSLNGGTVGDLIMRLNWGSREYSILLDGDISNALSGTHSRVHGYVTPKKDVPYHGLDLNIEADSLNVFFLNKYVGQTLDRLQGHATGHTRLFGPFKQLDIEGDLIVREGSIGIPYTGTRYTIVNDSVVLRPGVISFPHATIFGASGKTGQHTNSATLNGLMRHSHFSHLTYDINILADDMLAYDFNDFGDRPFYGTLFATGDIRMQGQPGKVDISIQAQPEQGTIITYDFSPRGNTEQSQLVTYIDRSLQEGQTHSSPETAETETSNDIRINFDLDIDNNTTMRLLMDARSGDMITVNGSGHMLARYHNKSDTQIFGTYRIDKGAYNLSIQEIIHKNFDLQSGGTVVFTGDPMNADINVQASHTVSGVSLNDISARSNFSNTSARVNCLMNITGKASQPYISFDFDILNVNEDEKQMIRSLISTEEERNMQVIYLLGIGRFYTYDYSNTSQSQSSTAMNSLLSSTLSGQINQMLSNMINNSNWNFGANVNTGNTGWSDLDVEGMLQGSLLNNRLIINGNFGYRDNPVNSSNFIGDFDAQYHLTRSGSVSLKAYNKTNDRYFTKSSLTTQGIGVLLKKDFASMWELFRRNNKKSKD